MYTNLVFAGSRVRLNRILRKVIARKSLPDNCEKRVHPISGVNFGVGNIIVVHGHIIIPPESYLQHLSSLCGKRYVRRGEVPAPAPRKSAGGGGAGGGGDACATSITTPGSPRLPRKASSAAAASTLAAVSGVVAHNN